MLPERLIPAWIADGVIVPSWFDASDGPWLRGLVSTMERFVGRPERELDAALALPLPVEGPRFKQRAAAHVVRRMYGSEAAATSCAATREALYLAAAAAGPFDRAAISAATAARLGMTVAELERAVTGDLPGERRVCAPKTPLDGRTLVEELNDAIARGLVARAREITVRADGATRALVRQAKLARLLCIVRDGATGTELVLSGPFSLFRHTLLYGRALGSVLGRLPYCARYEVVAECSLRGRLARFELRSADRFLRLVPGSEPREHDSKLEARFARELGRHTTEWSLVREPEPLRAGETLVFPDFALVHRLDPARRVLIEIVGFWTAEYLRKKLEALRAIDRPRLLVCIDEALACDEGALPVQATVVRFRRRVPVDEVLARIVERGW